MFILSDFWTVVAVVTDPQFSIGPGQDAGRHVVSPPRLACAPQQNLRLFGVTHRRDPLVRIDRRVPQHLAVEPEQNVPRP